MIPRRVLLTTALATTLVTTLALPAHSAQANPLLGLFAGAARVGAATMRAAPAVGRSALVRNTATIATGVGAGYAGHALAQHLESSESGHVGSDASHSYIAPAPAPVITQRTTARRFDSRDSRGINW